MCHPLGLTVQKRQDADEREECTTHKRRDGAGAPSGRLSRRTRGVTAERTNWRWGWLKRRSAVGFASAMSRWMGGYGKEPAFRSLRLFCRGRQNRRFPDKASSHCGSHGTDRRRGRNYHGDHFSDSRSVLRHPSSSALTISAVAPTAVRWRATIAYRRWTATGPRSDPVLARETGAPPATAGEPPHRG